MILQYSNYKIKMKYKIKLYNQKLFKKTCLLAFVLFWVSINSYSQDVHFSQYYEMPIYINPANTGAFIGGQRLVANYKNQWQSFGSPFRTYGISYDRPISGIISSGYLAVGGMVFNDVAGDAALSNLSGQVSLAYHVQINNNQFFTGAFYVGFSQRSLNASLIKWGNQYDGYSGYNPNLPTGETFTNHSYSHLHPDVGIGFLWALNRNASTLSSNDNVNADAGISFSHLNSPVIFDLDNFGERLNPRISAHGRLELGQANSYISYVGLMLINIQGRQVEITPGALAKYTLQSQSKYTGYVQASHVYAGAYYRLGDAFIVQTMAELKNYGFGISYDFTTSKLATVSKGRGGVELFFKYIIPHKNRSSSLI